MDADADSAAGNSAQTLPRRTGRHRGRLTTFSVQIGVQVKSTWTPITMRVNAPGTRSVGPVRRQSVTSVISSRGDPDVRSGFTPDAVAVRARGQWEVATRRIR
jgi:hypothetical protein